MGFSCGIVGLPNAGKSTLFNALSSSSAEAQSFPFCTIDPNRAVVSVPDGRLQALARMLRPEKATPTTLQIWDIAGLVKGAHQGEGLGNKFLATIREVDALVHVVRCFDDGDVPHVDGSVEPRRDMEVIEAELLLADLDTASRRLDKSATTLKKGDKSLTREVALLERLVAALGAGRPASTVVPDNVDERAVLDGLFLLTMKPMCYVANVGEPGAAADTAKVAEVEAHAAEHGRPVVVVAAKLQEEIGDLEDPDDRALFMEELGLDTMALDEIIVTGYRLLDLVTFYTTVGTELRAWTIPQGASAVQAAGKIHTDMAKGFVRAEVLPFEALERLGSEAKVRDKGLLRIEGRDYVVKDGDILTIKF